MRATLLSLAVGLATATSTWGQLTYTRDVARIVQAKCAICHRPNDIAPFSLLTYDDAVTYSADMLRVINEGLMPPWKPVAPHGTFRDSYQLTDEERQTLLSWLGGPKDKGDDADLPPVPDEQGEWVLGQPDQVLEMPTAYQPPRGRDMYRCFVLPATLEEDQWVSAIDILPGNRRSVHHAIVYLDESGEAEKLDGQDGQPGYTCYGGPGVSLFNRNIGSLSDLLGFNYTLGGWAPGSRPHQLPDGVAMRLRKQARVVLQIHYYTALNEDADQTRIGLYFAKKPVSQALYFFPMIQTRLEIPANAPDHEVRWSFIIPPFLDAKVVQVFPHMHLLGRRITAEVQPLFQQPQPLIRIDDWDFNWQGSYFFEKPVDLPSLSTIRMSCRYDNSANNPRNPSNPPKVVRWGEGTEDEMCVAFLGITFNNENLIR